MELNIRVGRNRSLAAWLHDRGVGNRVSHRTPVTGEPFRVEGFYLTYLWIARVNDTHPIRSCFQRRFIPAEVSEFGVEALWPMK